MPPTLAFCNTESLGERIQQAFPETRVVKTLNTVNAEVMVNPSLIPGGRQSIFVCGNDLQAKAHIVALLESFGWPASILDLGDISSARGTEMYLALWLHLWGALGTGHFNIHVVRA